MHFKSPALCFRVDGKHFENPACRKQWRHESHVISLPDFSPTKIPDQPVIVAYSLFSGRRSHVDGAVVPDLLISVHERFATYSVYVMSHTQHGFHVLNLKDDLQFTLRNLNNLISARLTRWNAERCYSLPNNASLSMKHLKLFFQQFLVSSKGRCPEKNAV